MAFDKDEHGVPAAPSGTAASTTSTPAPSSASPSTPPSAPAVPPAGSASAVPPSAPPASATTTTASTTLPTAPASGSTVTAPHAPGTTPTPGAPVGTITTSAPKKPEDKNSLAELNTDLSDFIRNKLAADHANQINAVLAEETTTLDNSSLEQLDSKSEVPLSDTNKSKSLSDKQAATKKQLDKLFATLSVNDDHQKEISSKLQAVHQMREALLKKTLDTHFDGTMDRAYTKFRRHMGLDGPNSVQTVGSSRKKMMSHFENGNTTIGHPTDTQRALHYDGNEFESNDPVALGYGLVAAGNKSITLTAERPKLALAAAKAALEAGAEEIKFDPETKQKLMNPYDAGYKSYAEFLATRAEYQAIQNELKARRRAKQELGNTVFNDNRKEPTKAEIDAHTFKNMNPFQPGFEQMVNRMPANELAKMAIELKGPFVRGTTKYESAHDLIKGLMHDPAGSKTILFEEKYGKRVAKTLKQPYLDTWAKTPAHTDANGAPVPERPTADASTIVKFISQQKNPYVRYALYEQIHERDPNLGAAATPQDKSDFKNQVRLEAMAAAFSGFVESRYNQRNGRKIRFANDEAAKAFDINFQNELMPILTKTTPQEREQLKLSLATWRENQNNAYRNSNEEKVRTLDRLFAQFDKVDQKIQAKQRAAEIEANPPGPAPAAGPGPRMIPVPPAHQPPPAPAAAAPGGELSGLLSRIGGTFAGAGSAIAEAAGHTLQGLGFPSWIRSAAPRAEAAPVAGAHPAEAAAPGAGPEAALNPHAPAAAVVPPALGLHLGDDDAPAAAAGHGGGAAPVAPPADAPESSDSEAAAPSESEHESDSEDDASTTPLRGPGSK